MAILSQSAGAYDEIAPDDPAALELMDACERSIEKFISVFLRADFENDAGEFLPFSEKIHKPMFRIIDDDSIRYAALVAPRGGAKSSIFSKAMVIQRTVTTIRSKRKKFVLLISASEDLATAHVRNLKTIFEENELLRHFYGELRSDKWAENEIETANGTRILSRGALQSSRGLLKGASRPDLVILDDAEDPKKITTKEMRAKFKEWFYNEILPLVGLVNRNFRFLVPGTLTHYDSLIQNLMDDPSWNSVRLELCDDQFKSNWREAWSDRKIKSIYDMYSRQNNKRGFYREYRGIPVPAEDATFSEENLKKGRYSENGKEFLEDLKHIDTMILVDPAKSGEEAGSDPSAIVGLGVDEMKNRYYLRDAIRKRMPASELYAETFAMAKRLKACVIGVEDTGLKNFIRDPFEQEARARGISIPFEWLHSTQSKPARIEAALQNPVRTECFFINETVYDMVVEEFVTFPVGKSNHIIDAASYVTEMCERGGKWFRYQADDEEKEEDYESEYEDLEDEPALTEEEMGSYM